MKKTDLLKQLKLFLVLSAFTIGCKPSLAAVQPPMTKPPTVSQAPATSPVQPQVVEVENCNKIFKLSVQKLFYLTLAGINANRFTIDEIQSKSGYVLFSVGQRQFFASVIKINPQYSLLKITPCNSNYYFPIGIVQNMFRYIELNMDTPIEKLIVQ